MTSTEMDDVDRAILFSLQEDARNNTNAEISEAVGVSASTVGNRLKRLEESGVIKGYRPDIDYEQAGFPLRVLFVCTAPIADRHTFVREVLDIEGVVNVREMMTGEHNIHIHVVGASNDDITAIAHTIDDLGLRVQEEILMRGEYTQPSVLFDDGSR